MQVHSAHSPFVSCGFKGLTGLELLCDGQFFISPVSGETCLASVDELVPKYRRVTTLHFRSPHGDSMSMCIHESFWVRRLFLGNVWNWRNKVDQLTPQTVSSNPLITMESVHKELQSSWRKLHWLKLPIWIRQLIRDFCRVDWALLPLSTWLKSGVSFVC